jgi:hypothetical protein
MAAGEPKTNFSGGYEANSYISKRGLRTLPLEHEKDDGLGIRDGLEEILANYSSTRANNPLRRPRRACSRISVSITSI